MSAGETPRSRSERTRAFCDSLPRDSRSRLFVKIDSTLAEGSAVFLANLCHCLHPTVTVVAPANPSQGRQILDGQLVVHGQPSGLHLREWLKSTEGVICLDSSVDADLDAIVASASQGALLAGSAGLAKALARRLPPQVAPPPRPSPVTGEILVIGGSRQPIAAAQIEALRNASLDGILIYPYEVESWPYNWLKPGRALVVVGGDTLALAAEHFGVNCVTLHGECVPGVALSSMESGIVLATKPGGFGARTTLIDTVRFLKGQA